MGIRTYLRKTRIPVNIEELKAALYGPKVLSVSFPKAGTHLLSQFLSLLPLIVPHWNTHISSRIPQELSKISSIRKGQFIKAHLYWDPAIIDVIKRNNIISLFMIRDLRDIAVSSAHALAYMQTKHRMHHYFKSLESNSERLMAFITGINGKLLPDGIRSKSIGEHAMGFAPWLDESVSFTVRFEDLIGERGGGSKSKQVETIRAIARHLGIDLGDSQIIRIADKVFFERSRTFHKGKIGDWKNHFTKEHKRAFKDIAGEALIKFGYATDYDW